MGRNSFRRGTVAGTAVRKTEQKKEKQRNYQKSEASLFFLLKMSHAGLEPATP